MAPDAEVIIAGLGAMGSAAAYHLAARGRRVLGFDRFHPPHNLGSSHGRSRIIREAYFEGEYYVRLVQRAYDLWEDLERESGRRILRTTGGVMIGPPDGVLVKGSEFSAQENGLEYRKLSASELRHQFPMFAPSQEMVGVWEKRAGILFPELAVQTHLELAAHRGAQLHHNEPVLRWEPEDGGVRVFTEQRSYRADRLLLTAGAWMKSLLPDLQLPLDVERQVLFWFQPAASPEFFAPGRCPISIWEYAPDEFFYSFPDLGDGVKVALHHQGEITTADHVRREVGLDEVERMRKLLLRFLPGAAGHLKSAEVCVYTNTPDEHFLLDQHPRHPSVFIASPCSGHGFKFSSVVGEIAAARLAGEEVPFDLHHFRYGTRAAPRDGFPPVDR